MFPPGLCFSLFSLRYDDLKPNNVHVAKGSIVAGSGRTGWESLGGVCLGTIMSDSLYIDVGAGA